MNLYNIVCVAGTDTDVGKSVVSAGLLRALSEAKVKTQGLKLVQSGCLDLQDVCGPRLDAELYAAAAPACSARSLYSFARPCSPHLAARQQGQQLCAASLAATVRQEALAYDFSIVEGSGGVFVPLNEKESFLDFFVRLAAPVVLVVANRLGAINHALLSLEALAARQIAVPGLVFTETSPGLTEDERELRLDNVESIARMSGLPVLACLPFVAALGERAGQEQAAAWQEIAALLSPLARRLLADRAELAGGAQ